MTEDDFKDNVIKAAHLMRWRVHHGRAGQTKDGRWVTPIQGDSGFPDLVLAREKRVIFAELKSDTGRVRPEQQAWLDVLHTTKAEVYVWRPDDWDVITELLR